MSQDTGQNTTHIVLGFIFAVALIALNGIEYYFLRGTLNSTTVLYLVIQNVGIGLANSYYVSNVVLNTAGASIQTGQTK